MSGKDGVTEGADVSGGTGGRMEGEGRIAWEGVRGEEWRRG